MRPAEAIEVVDEDRAREVKKVPYGEIIPPNTNSLVIPHLRRLGRSMLSRADFFDQLFEVLGMEY